MLKEAVRLAKNVVLRILDKAIENKKAIKAGDRFLSGVRNKAVVFAVIGKKQ